MNCDFNSKLKKICNRNQKTSVVNDCNQIKVNVRVQLVHEVVRLSGGKSVIDLSLKLQQKNMIKN